LVGFDGVYSYNKAYSPPIPQINVELINPYTGQSIKDIPGFIDTGSDGTCIPTRMVGILRAVPSRLRCVVDFNGKETRKLAYRITVKVEMWNFELLEVVAVHGEEILIGRDILNQLKLKLNGKNEIFEISDP